jgi:hypothetical protein
MFGRGREEGRKEQEERGREEGTGRGRGREMEEGRGGRKREGEGGIRVRGGNGRRGERAREGDSRKHQYIMAEGGEAGGRRPAGAGDKAREGGTERQGVSTAMQGRTKWEPGTAGIEIWRRGLRLTMPSHEAIYDRLR